MLRSAFNFVVECSFFKNLSRSDALKQFIRKNAEVTSRSCSNQARFAGLLGNVYINRSAFQRNKCLSDKKPVVLLSGILTFLGLKEKTPEEKESELIMTIKRGILMMQEEKYDKAEQILHIALKLAQDQQNEDGITYVYDILANVAFRAGHNDKAEKLFVTVLQRLLSKGEEETSNRVVEISLKLAKIYEDNKDFKKAEQGFKFCIETLDSRLSEEDQNTLALWGMSMDWYGRFLLDMNRKTEALKCFKKAYEMCVKVNGLENEQTVVLLNDLGTVSSLIGDTESALNYFTEAKDIGNKLPDMRDLASIYVNLGHLYLLKEMYKESEEACRQGLKMARNYEDPVASEEASQCLENINKVFKNADGSKGVKKLSQPAY